MRLRNLFLQRAVTYLLNLYPLAFAIALYTTLTNKVCDHGRIPTRNSFETRSVFWGGHAVTLYVAKICTSAGTRTQDLLLHATLCYHSQTTVGLAPTSTLLKLSYLTIQLHRCCTIVCCSLEYIITILKFLQEYKNRVHSFKCFLPVSV